jgi:hypothetical protein
MEQGLLHLHNFMRWVVLLFALLTIVRSMMGMANNAAFTSGDRKTGLFLMISADIQLLLGFALYYLKGWFTVLTSGGDIMSNKANRFFAVEHLAGMLIAIILIHIGYAASKKNIADRAKHKKLFWFTLIAVLIIIATIPWPFREIVGRPLFPGMN